MPRIVVESGPRRGDILPLPPEDEVKVGRDASCLLRVVDARVSRVHFVLSRQGKHFVVEDRSRNGTYINGKRVERTTLHQGDMIRLGHTFLSYFEEQKDPYLGKTIAGYRIDHRLGRGAMGTVYRAVQVSLDRTVALKILSQDLADDGDFVRRFLEEARSEGRLNHPNVVQIYNAGQSEEFFYLSIEYMAGGSLQGVMDREGRLRPARVLPWILDATKALMWAEEQGIVHRDIKPDNLMLDERGTLKLGDFGIAADNRRSMTLVEGGKVVGTPLYMAPEQAMGKPVDHRVDLYALGSTLYTALSGAFPYDGDNSTEILVKKCKSPPQPLSKVAPDLPKKLIAVVEKSIACAPEERYQSARELHDALEQVRTSLKPEDGVRSGPRVSAPPGSSGTRSGTGTTRFFSGKRWKSRLVFTAVVLAVLIVGVVLIGKLLW